MWCVCGQFLCVSDSICIWIHWLQLCGVCSPPRTLQDILEKICKEVDEYSEYLMEVRREHILSDCLRNVASHDFHPTKCIKVQWLELITSVVHICVGIVIGLSMRVCEDWLILFYCRLFSLEKRGRMAVGHEENCGVSLAYPFKALSLREWRVLWFYDMIQLLCRYAYLCLLALYQPIKLAQHTLFLPRCASICAALVTVLSKNELFMFFKSSFVFICTSVITFLSVKLLLQDWLLDGYVHCSGGVRISLYTQRCVWIPHWQGSQQPDSWLHCHTWLWSQSNCGQGKCIDHGNEFCFNVCVKNNKNELWADHGFPLYVPPPLPICTLLWV